jgi:predicted HicB family RNase H-like nuclease
MNKLRYKGYVGTVEVSEEDNCLYGHVLDLPHETEITYEGETVAQLKENFMNAVDDYIAYCESKGVQPCKSCKGALNIRISPDAYTKIAHTDSAGRCICQCVYQPHLCPVTQNK